MSGFDGPEGSFSLTPTKASYWHGRRGCCGGDPWRMVAAHLPMAGFTVESHGTWWRVYGPGLETRSTDALFSALRGAPAAGESGNRRQ